MNPIVPAIIPVLQHQGTDPKEDILPWADPQGQGHPCPIAEEALFSHCFLSFWSARTGAL